MDISPLPEEEFSNVVSFKNGDLLDVDKCHKALQAYWKLNKAETRAFDRLCKRIDLQDKYLNQIDNEF